MNLGDKVTCIKPGTTLLQKDREYTIHDILSNDLTVLLELQELKGVLFSPWRFTFSSETQED